MRRNRWTSSLWNIRLKLDWIVIPPTCTANLTFTYYVPNVVLTPGSAAAASATAAATKSASVDMPIARREETAA